MARFIRKINENYPLPWSEALAARGDMIECDKDGKVVEKIMAALPSAIPISMPTVPPAPVVAEAPAPKPAEATEHVPLEAKPLEEMSKKELQATAASLGCKYGFVDNKATIILKITEFLKAKETGTNAGK